VGVLPNAMFPMEPRGRPIGDGKGWSMNERPGAVGVTAFPAPAPELWRCMLASLEREPASRHSSLLGQREGESERSPSPPPTLKPVRPRSGTPGPALAGGGAMPKRPKRDRSRSSCLWPCAIRAFKSSSSPSAEDDAVCGLDRGVLGLPAASEDERAWWPGASPMAPCGDGAGDCVRAEARTASITVESWGCLKAEGGVALGAGSMRLSWLRQSRGARRWLDECSGGAGKRVVGNGGMMLLPRWLSSKRVASDNDEWE
jgi:hypothetical protein